MEDKSAQKGYLLNFLRQHDIAALATIKPNGNAHATTIFYFADDDLKFYFLTKNQTLKFMDIKKNNSAALSITDEKTMENVQIEGHAQQVEYGGVYEPVVQKFTQNMEQNGRLWESIPITHINAGEYTFIQITPIWIRWVDFSKGSHEIKFEQTFPSV